MEASLGTNLFPVALSKKVDRPSKNDLEIINNIDKISNDLKFAHISFDNATDPVLIDSFIYDITSLNLKYAYYLKLCKERKLIANGF